MANTTVDLRLEFHGDRASGDAPEVRGGFAWIGAERRVAVEFGSEPLSEGGGRKAIRLARLAEQTNAPLLVVGRLHGTATAVFSVVRALRSARVRVTLVGDDWGALGEEPHIEVVPAIPNGRTS